MTTLDVTVLRDRPGPAQYSYSLSRSEGTLAGPLQQEYIMEVNQALVEAACKRIDKALQNPAGDPEGVYRTLRDRGSMLYKQLLLPPRGTVLELVRELHESSEPLLVTSNENTVPWELLHDGKEFLGLKVDMGRRSKTSTRVHGGRDIGPVRHALVVGDTLGDLPKSREEAEKISCWLGEQGIECTLLLGAEAEVDRVMLELSEGQPYDLFHFSGHVSSQLNASGLIVHHRELIDDAALRNLADRGAPPVVFINGCASADLTMSVCRSFMVMGAKTVVGTRSAVDDESALRFGETFYTQLRERVPAGAAVRAARRRLADASDHTWASFVLYGDPSARITTEPKPAPTHPTPPKPESYQFDPKARALMDDVDRIAADDGLVTSIHLLTGLVETTEIQERSLPRIGQKRLTNLRGALRESLDPDGTSTATPSGVPARLNGTTTKRVNGRPRVPFSDTVARVLALAAELVAAAGRGATMTVDDIAAALLRVGGSTCADLLALVGISMEQLLAPSGSGTGFGTVGGGWDGARVSLDALDTRAVGIVQCARLLSAVRGERAVSSYVLLQAFAVTGSEALSRALELQGQDVDEAFRSLAGVNPPRTGHLTSRVTAVLEGLSGRAQGRAGETELLLALLTDPESSAGKALERLGVDPERVVRDLSGSDPQPVQAPEPGAPELER